MTIQNNNTNDNKNRLQEERNTKSSNGSNTAITTASAKTTTTTTMKPLFIFNLGFLLGVLTTSFVGNISNIKISMELMEQYSKEITGVTVLTNNNDYNGNNHNYNSIFTSTLFASTTTTTTSGATTTTTDPFDTIAHYAFERIAEKSLSLQQNQQQQQQQQQRNRLDLKTWKKTTSGGLTNRDRILLSEIYRNATSVFEYGLGESTYIADHVGVPRYAGVDSDPVWIGMARTKIESQEFRFYLADIGPTKAWGYPIYPNSVKHVYNYQLAPLVSEPLPFDVYMVDGRFRFPCVLSSFLHASTRKLQLLQQQQQMQLQGIITTEDGSDNNATAATTTNTNTATDMDTIVLLHDCAMDNYSTIHRKGGEPRIDYHSADDLLDIIHHSGDSLCVFRRKFNTTNEQLLQRWMEFSNSIG